MTPIQTQKPNTSGLGALGGAVVGGLLGNQVGKGNGRIVGTVVGAVGGGVAGNQIEKTVSKDTHYEVRVRMDDGSHRTFTYEKDPAVQPGERVHLENGALMRG
ncbi:Outer membrane lipoprotein SlyB (fragment) [Cupriavidus necator]|uniref:Outer membrane lipoprotein SlyB n=1 Tax=Cupriavidus necator TaxID=106590 RepID=A0A1K0IFL4_CUPNE